MRKGERENEGKDGKERKKEKEKREHTGRGLAAAFE